jgi:hypothetical protein
MDENQSIQSDNNNQNNNNNNNNNIKNVQQDKHPTKGLIDIKRNDNTLYIISSLQYKDKDPITGIVNFYVRWEGCADVDVIPSTNIPNFRTRAWQKICRDSKEQLRHYNKWFDLIGDATNISKDYKNQIMAYYNIHIDILYQDNKSYCLILSLANMLFFKKILQI